MPGLHKLFYVKQSECFLSGCIAEDFDALQFKEDYQVHTKYDLDVQVSHFTKLAKHYQNRYVVSLHWADCLKASIL